VPADKKGVGKGHRLDDLHPGACKEHLFCRAVADDTLGASGAAVKTWKSGRNGR
jgi:hypothetical protein